MRCAGGRRVGPFREGWAQHPGPLREGLVPEFVVADCSLLNAQCALRVPHLSLLVHRAQLIA
eukprot:2820933-Lingulodinium_polyedra.AAC.1